jgi:hypothetical protein
LFIFDNNYIIPTFHINEDETLLDFILNTARKNNYQLYHLIIIKPIYINIYQNIRKKYKVNRAGLKGFEPLSCYYLSQL